MQLLKLLNWFGGLVTWTFFHLLIHPIQATYANYDEYGGERSFEDIFVHLHIRSQLTKLMICFEAYDLSTAEPTDNLAEPSSDAKVKADEKLVLISRTRLQPCDQVIPLFTLVPLNKEKPVYRIPARGCERYCVYFVSIKFDKC